MLSVRSKYQMHHLLIQMKLKNLKIHARVLQQIAEYSPSFALHAKLIDYIIKSLQLTHVYYFCSVFL